ncbi:FAD-dependent oxidoreductase [Actibacterium ureilyticum]|uniref:FAD-dependent oxidoreductase n=1 Tax=Actibacterium ureilyticum TaxID=1590614 RepID=UPI0015958C99|nr:FAD-dependent oxidoreductase [Actibacterium ureilyticum]
MMLTRRHFLHTALGGATALGAAGLIGPRARAEPVIVVGGGPAGARAALTLRRAAPDRPVILVERDPTRLRPVETALQGFTRPAGGPDHRRLRAAGVDLVLDDAVGVDWRAGRVELFSGRTLPFGRLVLAPGTAPRDEGIAGYDAAAAHHWPAAWGSPRAARRLLAQLGALPASAHVVLRLPADGGGYPAIAADRARALARYLRDHRPDARLTVLDGARQSQAAALYDAHLAGAEVPIPVDWRGPGAGGGVLWVNTARGVLGTDAGEIRADAVNFIVPQQAGDLARLAGLTDDSGWCPCDDAHRSRLRPQTMVLGDARKGATRTTAAARAQGRAVAAVLSA